MMSVTIIFSIKGVHQHTKVPDPLSGASRILQVFNLADCCIFSGWPSSDPRVLLEYHSTTSARIARLANSFAFTRPIHSRGDKSKKLNTLNTSGEIFSIGSLVEEFGVMHLTMSFGVIDSSEAVCSLMNAKLASIQDILAIGCEGSSQWVSYLVNCPAPRKPRNAVISTRLVRP
jgi:hypothetical protein